MFESIKKRLKITEKSKLVGTLTFTILSVLFLFHHSNQGVVKAEVKEDYYLELNGGIKPVPLNKEVFIEVNRNLDVAEVKLKLSIYKIDKDDLFKFIIYDNEGKRINSLLNTDKLDKLATLDKTFTDNAKISLPIQKQGLYYVEAESQTGFKMATIIVVSKNGTLATEGENKIIFWNQDLITGKKITEGNLTIYNFKNKVNKLKELKPNNQGIIETDYNKDYDFAFFEKDNDINIVKMNRTYLGQSGTDYYKGLNKVTSSTDNFIFTDRPIYRPGDTVNFKGILRDNLNGKLSLSKGNVKVKILQRDIRADFEGKVIFEKNYTLSDHASFDGSFKLDNASPTGDYEVRVSRDGTEENFYSSFLVEYYRKPNYFLETDTKVSEAVAGDNVTFTIKGKYFSGNPASNQKVKYQIVKSNFAQASYVKDKYKYENTYPITSGDAVLQTGEVTLNSTGVAELNYLVNFVGETNQIIQLETSLDDGSGNPATSSKRILAYRGLYDIFRNDDYLSSVKTNQNVNIPIILSKNKQEANVTNKELKINVTRSWWEKQENSTTGAQFIERKEESQEPSIKTDNEGKAVLSFTPKNNGSYTLKVIGNDERGNTIQNSVYIYAVDETNYYSSSQYKEYLTIKTDKDLYQRNGSINLSINSEIPNIDTLITIYRENILRYQVVSLQGNSKTVPISIDSNDIPNIYVSAAVFTEDGLQTPSKNVEINTDNKKLNIVINADKEKYAPGEDVTLNVDVKDLEGKPSQTELTLWLVDKALYELSDPKSLNIFGNFWYPRYGNTTFNSSLETISGSGGGYGGCFAEGTKILMENNQTKNIEDVKIGDNVLTKESDSSDKLVSAKVINTFKHTVSGYFLINGELKVTPEHIVFVNGAWMTADRVNIGDYFINSNGERIEVTSKEWIKGEFNVFNFTVEKYHTYFANNIYVHNEKGMAPRVNFKDVAYWNPALKTDVNGKAQVTFKLPDNLTSWTISAVGNTTSSQFGNTKKDIIVTKNIVIIPVLPNILREGDEIKVASLIQNFTDQDQNFDVTLKTENAGGLESPDKINVTLKPNEIKTVDFKLKVGTPTENAKFDFKVQSTKNDKDADQVVLSIPIREYGFFTYSSENSEGNTIYSIKKDSNINYNKSSILLGLTPTTLGAIPLALDYLIDYPYGCVEQTTSRLVAAIVVKKYPEFFSESVKGKNIDNVITQSLTRLDNLNTSFGWSFWNTYNQTEEGKERDMHNALITAYTLENILEAKKLGFSINDTEIDLTAKDLNNFTDEDYPIGSNTAAANYGLALTGKFDLMRKLNSDQMRTLNGDALSLQVMANYLAGDKNPESNGYNIFVNYIIVQDEIAYVEKGKDNSFGSRDFSTALALRTIILTGGDLNLAKKLNNYLITAKKNYYWSNTIATAESIKAILEFSKISNQENPNYSYQVKLDGKEINSGKVEKFNNIITPIRIGYSDIKDASNLEIIKNGDGKIYSNIVYKKFVTDKNYKSKNDKISISREYINAKGSIYNLGIGDIVDVTFKIKSNVGGSEYVILEDQLPAGLVPVNMRLKNEQFNREITQNKTETDPSKGVISDFEYTENGVLLIINDLSNQEKTYTYKARVVSEGKFIAPPAFISLMYSPNDNGNTSAVYIETFKEGKINPIKYVLFLIVNYGLVALKYVLIIFIIISIPTLIMLAYLRRNNLTLNDLTQRITEKFKLIIKLKK